MIRILLVTGLLLTGLISCKTADEAISKGTVTYDMEFSSDDPNVQAQLGMMQGSEMVLTFAEQNMKTEMKMGSIMTNTTIINGEQNKGLMLMSGMVGKKAVPMSKEDLEKENEESPDENDLDIEKTGETKEIAGFQCEKIILTTEEGDAIEMWVTDEIKPKRKDGRFVREGVGFPLMMETNQQGMVITFSAKEVVQKFEGKEKDIFSVDVPEGYEITTMEAIQGMGM